MKILAVADVECPALWEHYVRGRLDDYDLILGCGDLKAAYLTFLVTMSHARLLYVPGNHDVTYPTYPPEGCEDIDCQLVSYNGVRILGLGGCLWYHEGPYQITEKQMKRRISKLRRALKKAGGVDIVITHSPPRGLGDMDHPAHKGFECFRELIDQYHPKYFIHGHTHLNYDITLPRSLTHGETQVINAYERHELDYPVECDRSAELIWFTKHHEDSEMLDFFRIRQ
ncbi:MAG: metallophosphoesterase [Erysipelotrichaceae bacterium]|nr:metallophosphoesterase [Erysipelotrichaceae bacterium]